MVKIENGFIVGRDWHNKEPIMINVQHVLYIGNSGNSPPAARVHFVNSDKGYRDVMPPEAAKVDNANAV